MGQQFRRYGNLLNGDFHTDGPSRRQIPDVPCIDTNQGVLHWSTIRDLCDNRMAAYGAGTRQTANLVPGTIPPAIKEEKKNVAAALHLHSGQGFPCTAQAYSG